MTNDIPIAGIQFELLGITPTNVTPGDIIPNDAWVADCDAICLFHLMLTNESIPPGEGILATITFTDYTDDEICFVNHDCVGETWCPTIANDPNNQPIWPTLGDCYENNAEDCTGDMNYDGSYNVLDIVLLANCVLVGNCDD